MLAGVKALVEQQPIEEDYSKFKYVCYLLIVPLAYSAAAIFDPCNSLNESLILLRLKMRKRVYPFVFEIPFPLCHLLLIMTAIDMHIYTIIFSVAKDNMLKL